MKRRLMYAVVVAWALMIMACGGVGKYFGGGTVPSAVDAPKSKATFAIRLVAEDATPEDDDADTFSGMIQYRDKAAFVAIHGTVLSEDHPFFDPAGQGVYYDDVAGQYGAFVGNWTGSVLTLDGELTEGAFLILVRDDPEEIYGGDGLWLLLYEQIEDINIDNFPYQLEDNAVYSNLQEGTVRGNIEFVPVKD